MEQIIKTYGGFLLEAVVAVLLLLLLLFQITDTDGNSGIFRIVGANIASKGTDYSSYQDFAVYAADSEKMSPVIYYTGDSHVCVGDDSWADFLCAEDYAGERLPVKILSVTDPLGIESPWKDGAKTELAQAGIYQIKVTAVDAANKRTTCVVKIPVNG
jgi:hypothetical protein